MAAPGQRTGAAPARRRWWPFLLGFGLVVVLAAIGWLVFGGDDDAATPSATATTTGGAAPPDFPTPSPVATVAPQAPFTDDDAQRIAAALTSDDPRATAAVLAPDVREAFLADATPALPKGATVTVLTDRFLAVRPDYASVPLVVSGEQSADLLAVLSYVDGQWLIEATEEVA